jgi:quercetin dioxygenase-like cupin family protein
VGCQPAERSRAVTILLTLVDEAFRRLLDEPDAHLHVTGFAAGDVAFMLTRDGLVVQAGRVVRVGGDVTFRQKLEALGWSYDSGVEGPPPSGRIVSECYPYTALVGAEEFGFDDERPRYKRKPKKMKAAEFRPLRSRECDRIIAGLDGLADADPPLDLRSHPVTAALAEEPSPEHDGDYKHREDLIDAVICAWTGLLWLRSGFQRCQVLGQTATSTRRSPSIIAPARPQQRRDEEGSQQDRPLLSDDERGNTDEHSHLPGTEASCSGVEHESPATLDDPEDLSAETATVLTDIASEVEIPPDGTLSRVLYQDERLRLVVFAFDGGQELTEHAAAVPAVVQVLRGSLLLTLAGEETTAEVGSWVRMPANLPHSVHALEPSIMLLTMLPGG